MQQDDANGPQMNMIEREPQHAPSATNHSMSGMIKQVVDNHQSLQIGGEKRDFYQSMSMANPRNAMGNRPDYSKLNFRRRIPHN